MKSIDFRCPAPNCYETRKAKNLLWNLLLQFKAEMLNVIREYSTHFSHEQTNTQLHLLQTGCQLVDVRSGVLWFILPKEMSAVCRSTEIDKNYFGGINSKAASEHSFSIMHFCKAWLQSTIGQSRLNWSMIWHVRKDKTDV